MARGAQAPVSVGASDWTPLFVAATDGHATGICVEVDAAATARVIFRWKATTGSSEYSYFTMAAGAYPIPIKSARGLSEVSAKAVSDTQNVHWGIFEDEQPQ